MTPAQHTRIVLSEFRAIGVPFPIAWAAAMRMLPRRAPDYREWKGALNWSKPAFRAFYEGHSIEVVHVHPEQTELVLHEGSPEPPVRALAAV